MQPTADLPTPTLTGDDIDIRPGLILPLPDDAAGAAARDRLSTVDIGVSAPTIAALGMLAEAVVFIAAVQGTAHPRPLLSTRVVLLTGSHAGGVVAGPAPDPRNATPLQHLAINAGAGIVTLEWQPASAAIEFEDAITTEQMDASLRAGWAEAERAADEGIELLVLAAGGAGASVAAAAVVAAITGAEPTMLLTRVVTPAGIYDDNAWMTRCLALRDALHRVRQRDGDPRTVLAALGGADLAAATGLILGAASRRTPIMIDGPVGAAAALLANDFSPQSRSWVVLPDHGRHPAVRLAADSLQLRPWLDLGLDLGEGAASLSALPLLQTALTLAGAGEEVEPQPLSRFDSTGNQIFVGVAKPVDAEGEPVAEPEAFTGSTVETAPVIYASGHATGEPASATRASAPTPTPTPTDAASSVDSASSVESASVESASSVDSVAPADEAAQALPDRQQPVAPKTGATTAAGSPVAGRPEAAQPTAGDEKAAAKPTKATADATRPSETTKPADGVKPADGAKPGDGVKPGDTAKPGDGVKPGDAVKPADGVKPRPEGSAAAPRVGVKPPTRTATKPPPKAGAKPALTGRTGAAKTVPAKAAGGKDTPTSKDAPAAKVPPSGKDTTTVGDEDAQAAKERASANGTPTAKDVPAKDVPTKNVPAQDVPAKDVPTKDVGAKDVPAKDVPAKDVPTKDVGAKDVPAKDVPAQDVTTKDVPTKDATANGAPSKDAPGSGARPAAARAQVASVTADQPSSVVDEEPTEVVRVGSALPSPPRPRKRS